MGSERCSDLGGVEQLLVQTGKSSRHDALQIAQVVSSTPLARRRASGAGWALALPSHGSSTSAPCKSAL